MNDEPLVGVSAAAKYLDVCTKTIRRMVAAGELECRWIGRQLKFEPRVLRAHNSRPPRGSSPAPAEDFRGALAELTYEAA